ncbi:disease resistance protein RGA2-like [Gossypium arboreum]|uniref:disease resistance protein RGA2-like n=1 Tax=Gossypium arboreum TaxID=29729 RepID=UPI0008190330|nr:disease resistance protein RGA2-like [Gossypium arboreum]
MALGFIQPLSEDEDLEDAGYEYFKYLVWRSFLDCESMDYLGKCWFTMHDLMHDLAYSVAGEEYCIVGLKTENVNGRSRHVSFDAHLVSPLEIRNTLLRATKVRSFAGNMNLPLFLQYYIAPIANCKYLRMLDLSGSNIKMLPHSTGNLKHLKALYLSNIKSLLKLPSSLPRLQLLETLDLDWCSSLRTLPSKTSRLVSLKHLQLEGCAELDYMPRGLGKLTRLQKLSWFVVGRTTGEVRMKRSLNASNHTKSREAAGDRVSRKQDVKLHLPPLHQLYSLKVIQLSRLEALENVSETEMQEELVSGKSTTIFFPSLEELQIDDCPNFKGWWKGDVGEASNPHLPCFPCLSHLTINHCPNLTTMPLFPSVTELELKNTSSKPFQETMKLKLTKIEAPSSILDPRSRLEYLYIDEVKDLGSMSSLHQLYSLKVIRLSRLEALENVSKIEMQEELVSGKSTTIFFPSLEELQIDDCPNLKG